MIASAHAAVVVTVTVAAEAVLPSSVSDAGLTLNVASDGAPVHVRLNAPVKPPSGANASV